MNKKIIFFFIFIAIIVLIQAVGVTKWISLEQLKMHRDYLQHVVSHHYFLSVFFYIVVYVIAIAFSLPIGAILTIAGGFLFGVIAGTFYTNIGATSGATLSFLLVRYFVGDAIQQKYAVQLEQFNKLIALYGSNYLLVIRFIAVIPFFLVNILAGMTTISLWVFIWTTAIGILPASFVYTFAGQQLTTIESVNDLFSWRMLLMFFCLALLALVPIIFSYRQQRNKEIEKR